MGLFFTPPPGPIIGATAAQPYGQPKLPPVITAVPVNNPPFANPGRTPNAIWQAAFARQPDPWPYVFLDKTTGAQPYGPPTNFPQSLAVTRVPFSNQWMASVIQSWFPSQTILLSGISAAPRGIEVDNPPFGQHFFYPPYPSDHVPPQRRVFAPPQQVVVQTPYVRGWMATVVQSWVNADLAPTLPRYLNPTVTAVRVDNPPFNPRPFIPPYPVDSAAPQPRQFVPHATVVSQGPYSNVWLASIVQSWFGADPPPTLPRLLNPSITGVRVDNPPFGVRWQSPAYPAAPLFVQAVVGLPPPGTAVVQTPYSNYWLASVVQSWFPGDPLPTLPRYLNPTVTAVRVDNPPFNQRTFFPSYPETYVAPQGPVRLPQGAPVVVSTFGPYRNYWLATVLQSWQPNDPAPTVPRYSAAIPGWSVDNPPGSEGNLVIQWIPDDPDPTLPRHLPAGLLTVPVNNPPFTHYGRTAWVADLIVRAWQPPDPQPTLSGKLNPSALAVPVNNPPFSSRSELANILAQWQFPPPLPTPSVPPPQVQPGPPPPPVTSQFTVSGPDVSVYLQEFSYDVVYTDAPVTKRTV